MMDGQDVDDPPIGQEGCSAGVGMRPEMDWTRRTELRRRTVRLKELYSVERKMQSRGKRKEKKRNKHM